MARWWRLDSLAPARSALGLGILIVAHCPGCVARAHRVDARVNLSFSPPFLFLGHRRDRPMVGGAERYQHPPPEQSFQLLIQLENSWAVSISFGCPKILE